MEISQTDAPDFRLTRLVYSVKLICKKIRVHFSNPENPISISENNQSCIRGCHTETDNKRSLGLGASFEGPHQNGN